MRTLEFEDTVEGLLEASMLLQQEARDRLKEHQPTQKVTKKEYKQREPEEVRLQKLQLFLSKCPKGGKYATKSSDLRSKFNTMFGEDESHVSFPRLMDHFPQIKKEPKADGTYYIGIGTPTTSPTTTPPTPNVATQPVTPPSVATPSNSSPVKVIPVLKVIPLVKLKH